MCGIAGILSRDTAPDPVIVREMISSLRHRGPDGEGIEGAEGVCFGHRRLSIIDLAGSPQPMWSHDRRLLVTFNGEIFNYLELRSILERDGARFHTSGDTEVILEAFRRWGVESFSRLNGQFAFALYEHQAGTVYLVRDRIGEKPLYLSVIDGCLLFGSEVKAIIAARRALHRVPTIDPVQLLRYLAFNYVPFGDTLLCDISSVPAASYVAWRDGSISTSRYWSAPFEPTLTLPEAAEELNPLLGDAARLRLRSDVSCGLFLSGGIDSVLAASYLTEQGGCEAFTAHFSEKGFSEAADAQDAAARLGMTCTTVDIDPNPATLPELVHALARHGDAPLADSSSVPLYLLSRETRRAVTVVISGDGGDELFGGYLTYEATALATRIPKAMRTALSGIPIPVVSRPGKVGFLERISRFTGNLSYPPGVAHFAWNGALRVEEARHVIHRDMREATNKADPYEEVARVLGVSWENPTTEQLLSADQRNYLPYDILAKVDRMTLAHGLEARPLFLDHRVVEVARRCRPEILRRKAVLKQLLAARCPWYPLRRKKQGFSIPIHTWFRTALRQFVSDLLSSEGARHSPLFEHRAVMRIWEDHLKGTRNAGFELWGIMIALVWYEEIMRGVGSHE